MNTSPLKLVTPRAIQPWFQTAIRWVEQASGLWFLASRQKPWGVHGAANSRVAASPRAGAIRRDAGLNRPEAGSTILKMSAALFSPCKMAVLAIIVGVSLTANAALKVGDTLPDLASFKLQGKLPDSLKGKVVIVDFWASWCLPCAESFPVLDELQKKYGDKLVVIAVNVDEKASNMDKFLLKHPVSFTVVRDSGQKLVATVSPETMPTSFILDGEGKVRFLHSGFHGETTRKEYLSEIETLLK